MVVQYQQAFNNKNISSLHSAYFNTDIELALFVRKNFRLPNIIRLSHLQQWTNLISNLPIVILQYIDCNFLYHLYNHISSSVPGVKHLLESTQMQKFINVLDNKMLFIERLINQYFQVYLSGSKSKQIKQLHTNKQRQLKLASNRLKQYFFENLLNIIQCYKQFHKKPTHNNKNIKENERQNNISSKDIELIQFIFEYKDLYKKTQNKNKDWVRTKQYPQYLNLIECKEFIQKITHHLEQIDKRFQLLDNKGNQNDQNIQFNFPLDGPLLNQSKTKQFLLSHLQIENCGCKSCLNCIQFLYQLPAERERNDMIDYAVFQSVKSIKKQQHKILEAVGAFLNDKGGTLLFDCKQTIFGFMPKGQKMNLKEQESYKSSFEHLLRNIKPQSLKKFITCEIDFLPLKQNPEQKQGQLKGQFCKIERSQKNDHSIMRVKVRSKNSRYFFGVQIDKKIYFFSRENLKTKQLNDDEIYSKMSQKNYRYVKIMNKFELNKIKQKYKNKQQQFMQILKGRRQTLLNFHEGQCKQTLIITTRQNNKNL